MKMLMRSMFMLLCAVPLLASSYNDDDGGCSSSCRSKNHDVQFQLFDAFGWPVENTEFWATIKLHKDGSRVSLSLPSINFQTGQYAAADPLPALYASRGYIVFEGGTLRAIDGFLPKSYRPTDPMYRSFIVPSNNGQSLAFSYATTFDQLPTPPSGYMLSINYAGQLIIQGIGTFNNNIAPGFQVMMPTDISYYHEKTKSLCDNVVISSGASNITGFTDGPANLGYRDSHVNDAYNNIVASAWSDNSNAGDPNTLNLMVSIGQVINGKLEMGAPVQLTNLPSNVTVWDTAIAIDRVSSNTIVVSYGIIDFVTEGFLAPPCRAVSFDGGKTWPAPYVYTVFTGSISGTTLSVTDVSFGSLSIGDVIYTYLATSPDQYVEMGTIITAGPVNGGPGIYTVNKSQTVNSVIMNASASDNGIVPVNTPYSRGFGDNRGVSSDKFGNIWYCTTNLTGPEGLETSQPFFWCSTDGGLTFGNEPAFVMEPEFLNPNYYGWDYPQYCFGGDEFGNYGLWAVSDNFRDPYTITNIPSVGFIPITGLGLVGTGSNIFLDNLENESVLSNPTASPDGRVWFYGYNNHSNLYPPRTLSFKSPGPIDENYIGGWQPVMTEYYGICNYILGFAPLEYSSYPAIGYFDSVQTILFDEQRQALYALIAQNAPDLSQDMTLYIIISRNNGQSWSEPFEITSSTFANRGFQSMALDTTTGNLIFNWYDGRNDPTQESVEYMGAVLPAKKLDRMVKNIPVSNPTYITGPVD